MPKPSKPKDPLRVVVFIDEANVFEDAQRAFGSADPKITGRIKPMRYGMRLVEREVHGCAGDRVLHEVRVYAGQPSSAKDSKAYGAHRKQSAAWTNAGATVITRPLRYPRGYPRERPVQKGVDVHLAIDIVTMAIRKEYDVGIIASADTDLRPAIEACADLPEGCPIIEVAAWRGEGYASRLQVPGKHVWCHFLERDDYLAVADHTRYAAG
jgi:uncharacterized LabA/DUF88 family protein